jgi:hypothetical protein
VSEARKDDAGKPRYDLIPPEWPHDLALLLGKGAAKYGERNFEKGMRYGRCFAAAMRHAWAFWRGESHDEEGNPHLVSAAWNLLTIHMYTARGVGTDDRSAKEKEIVIGREFMEPSK